MKNATRQIVLGAIAGSVRSLEKRLEAHASEDHTGRLDEMDTRADDIEHRLARLEEWIPRLCSACGRVIDRRTGVCECDLDAPVDGYEVCIANPPDAVDIHCRPYTSAQLRLAAERYVDAMCYMQRDACDDAYVTVGVHLLLPNTAEIESMQYDAAGSTVSDCIERCVDKIWDDRGLIDWSACEARRAETGRGTPLFDPPEKSAFTVEYHTKEVRDIH